MRTPAVLTLVAALAGGCGSICDPLPLPSESCVAFAQGADGFSFHVAISPECGIVSQAVEVQSLSFGAFEIEVDAEGRGTGGPFSFFVNETLELRYQSGGCPLSVCVRMAGPGPGRPCDSFPIVAE